MTIQQLGGAQVGSTILLRLRIESPVDVAVREAEVAVRCTTTYFQLYATEAFGWTPQHERRPLGKRTFPDFGRIAAGTYHDEECRFIIPCDAAPTAFAKRLWVIYVAVVRVKFDNGTTVRRKFRLHVRSPRDLYRQAERNAYASDLHDHHGLTLELDRRHVRPGEKISGRLDVVAPLRSVTPPVVVELVRREEASLYFRPHLHISREWTVARQALSEGVGPYTAVLPFELTIPERICPTVVTDHTRVRWVVYARLEGNRRTSAHIGHEINVYNGGDGEPEAFSDAYRRNASGLLLVPR